MGFLIHATVLPPQHPSLVALQPPGIMPTSPYLAGLRAHVGHALILTPAVAALLRDEHGRLRIGRVAHHDVWTLLTGHLDPGETLAEAVVREVLEETRLDVVPTQRMAVLGGEAFRMTSSNGDPVEGTVVVCACERMGGHWQRNDGEWVELRDVSPRERPVLPLPYPPALLDGTLAPGYFQPPGEGI